MGGQSVVELSSEQLTPSSASACWARRQAAHAHISEGRDTNVQALSEAKEGTAPGVDSQ